MRLDGKVTEEAVVHVTGVIRVGKDTIKVEKSVILIERVSITGVVAVPKGGGSRVVTMTGGRLQGNLEVSLTSPSCGGDSIGDKPIGMSHTFSDTGDLLLTLDNSAVYQASCLRVKHALSSQLVTRSVVLGARNVKVGVGGKEAAVAWIKKHKEQVVVMTCLSLAILFLVVVRAVRGGPQYGGGSVGF